jgi:hypothetical protein
MLRSASLRGDGDISKLRRDAARRVLLAQARYVPDLQIRNVPFCRAESL